MAAFNVDIYTPQRIVARGLEARSIKLPTTHGEINLLAEHTHIVSKLDTGVLEVETPKGIELFTMTTGVCKVLGDEVTILAQCCEKSSEIDIERAKDAANRAKQKLNQAEKLTVDELVKQTRKLDRAEIRIKLALKR